jgi:hypothetical protein
MTVAETSSQNTSSYDISAAVAHKEEGNKLFRMNKVPEALAKYYEGIAEAMSVFQDIPVAVLLSLSQGALMAKDVQPGHALSYASAAALVQVLSRLPTPSHTQTASLFHAWNYPAGCYCNQDTYMPPLRHA